MPQQPIDNLDFLEELVSTPDPLKGTRTRKPKDTRDQDTWFKLDHINNRCLDCGAINSVERGYDGATEESSFLSHCMICESTNVQDTGCCSQGENCIGAVLYDKGPERVTAIVNEVEMCRFDFLDGLAHVND